MTKVLVVLAALLARALAQTTPGFGNVVATDVETQVANLLSQMTLAEKVGQMIMDAENAAEFAPSIGAYLIGASDPPAGNTPAIWRNRQNELQALSANSRLGIPVLIATDAVHGQNIVSGGTIFPHNIGLGCTRNPQLVKKVAQATAREMISTGLDMTFAPTIAVARTISWGRTYEAYSEDTDLVGQLGKAFIEGLQGTSTPWNVIATAKHWVGDGGTTMGDDAGDTALDEATLLAIHGKPYIDAIAADVGSIMVSFSSVNGETMHSNRRLITEVLKGEMGFEGFVLSDWEGYLRNDGSYTEQIQAAVNAGIDMLMNPYQAYSAMDAVTDGVTGGNITIDRIDDAVTRILRTKIKAGLLTKKGSDIDATSFEPIGSAEHRDVGRQAVRESLVLLKNENNVLPLKKNANILLAGRSADNLQNQCGGWTMSWQGTSDLVRHQIVGGTSIFDGMSALNSGGSVTLDEDGSTADPALHDVAVVVIGETPYAEGLGDDLTLALNATDLATIANVQASGVPMVLVLVSGRPLIITNQIDAFDAVVAAWLPGTEGDGVAEVLYGDFDFSGTLSFSWPRNAAQVLGGFVGDNPNVLFEFGFGLDYARTANAPTIAPVAAPTPSAPKPTPMASAPSPPTSASSDQTPPSKPGTPYVLDATAKSITIRWDVSTDNDRVLEYLVFSGSEQVGRVRSRTFTHTGLEPSTSYTYYVVAVDVAGNISPSSNTLKATTHMLVDDFSDMDDEASDSWGVWRFSSGGLEEDGVADLEFGVDGFEDFGITLTYTVDSGDAGFANVFLDFQDGETIDLTQAGVVGVQFMLRGEPGTSIRVHIATPLAEFIWIYYQSRELEPSDDWELVTVLFEDLTASTKLPYSRTEALENASALVVENANPGQTGSFSIDEVSFITEASEVEPDPLTGGGPSEGNVVNVMVPVVVSSVAALAALW